MGHHHHHHHHHHGGGGGGRPASPLAVAIMIGVALVFFLYRSLH